VCLLQERDKRAPVEDAYSALLEVDCLHPRTVNRKRSMGYGSLFTKWIAANIAKLPRLIKACAAKR
jgi:hypothetical protein